ncbi:hypothetical protein HSR121_1507 [Halapricum desulfuricans]|uniref:Uncharacterized protein n=2 Tax=Halapricum desulfuricans TaxID=2841257 RepID=A0A897MUN3_9EURY|nr:hypothetical protein HSR121_1507 [Halapricum desulfuricans]
MFMDMTTTEQVRARGNRNEVPDDVSPAATTDRELETSGRTPPFDAFAVSHMRAVNSDRSE